MRKINLIKVSATFLLMMSFYSAFSQVSLSYKKNQFNNKGQKEGFWVEKSTYWIRESYFKYGMLSGVYKEFNSDGKLYIFGEYLDDKRCGTWYFFNDMGALWMIFKDFSKNTASIINEGDKKRYVPDYKCRSFGYYPNGNVQEEGWLLWSEGDAPESDMSVKYGEWKYYDESGKFIRAEVYK